MSPPLRIADLLPPRVTDLFRAKFGVESLKEVRPQDFASWESISPVAEVYTEWSRMYTEVPQKSSPGFRPIITTSALSLPDEHIVAARSLLLCDSVAVVIPNSINFGIRFLVLATVLESAIDSGLVIFVPDGLTNETHKYMDAWLQATASSATSSSSAESSEKTARAMHFLAGAEVAWNLDLCISFPDKFDLACMKAGQTSYIREVLQTLGDELPASMMSTHDQLRYLHRAVSVPFPTLELPVAEMMSVRKDGLFDAWRVAVNRSFEKMGSLDQDQLLDPNSAQLAIIKESLEDSVDELRRQLNRSDVLRRSVCGSTGFALSTVCGALGSIGGPVIGGAAAGAGFLGGALIEWLGGRPGTGERAFKRLIVQVFNEG